MPWSIQYCNVLGLETGQTLERVQNAEAVTLTTPHSGFPRITLVPSFFPCLIPCAGSDLKGLVWTEAGVPEGLSSLLCSCPGIEVPCGAHRWLK